MIRIIKEYADSYNLIYGICDGNDLGLEFYGDVCDIPFFRGEVLDRISPKRFLDNAGSVLVIGAEIENKPLIPGLENIMAPSASGADYHKRLNSLAEGMALAMLERRDFNYKIHVDSGPLMETAFAMKAGLGFQGMNKGIISEKFGAFFNIALIVTDLRIEDIFSAEGETENAHNGGKNFREHAKNFSKCAQDCRKCAQNCPADAFDGEDGFDYRKCITYLKSEMEIEDIFSAEGETENAQNSGKNFRKHAKNFSKCAQDCRKCAQNYPSGAFDGEDGFDYRKCISYLTQKKGVLSENEMRVIGVSIYGCDICRNVCPYNSRRAQAGEKTGGERELLIRILNMGKSEFEKTFENSNFAWRGRTTIRRNCLIALYNLGGESNLDVITEYLDNSNEILRNTAQILTEMA